jgi:hypothetical protein
VGSEKGYANLKPFAKGYDKRRDGSGRKPYVDIRERLEKVITTEDIVAMLHEIAKKGDIRALQEIFKICGTYAPIETKSEIEEVITLEFTNANPDSTT